MERMVLRKPIYYWLVWLIVVILWTAGCSGCIRAPATQLRQPLGPRLIYQDEFNLQNRAWTAEVIGQGEAGIYDGVFRVMITSPNSEAWAVPGLNLGDARIEVDAIRTRGDRNNRFGLICRFEPPSNYYVLMIGSDGYYGIGKVKGTTHQLLGSPVMLSNDIIPPGTQYMQLRADCIKDSLALYVNNEKIAEVYDSEFTSGDVGLIAGAYSTPGVEVFFDNFRVYQP
jgi:hypothetical protein